jgi:acetoin utilization deacetylase AcuC-like enzyme
LNIPLKAGAGDQEFIEAFREKIVPTTRAYRPDLVLLSSGFDAHQADLLSGTMATEKSFDAMLDMTMELAEETCTGRLISTLEGGYNLKALSSCVLNHLRRLAAL